MNKKTTSNPVSLAVGAVFAAGMAIAPAVQADVNPFAVSALSSGYMVADKGAEGNCGAKKPVAEAKCGESKAAKQIKEAECGANKAQPKPIKEAKCGEAKCGANKK